MWVASSSAKCVVNLRARQTMISDKVAVDPRNPDMMVYLPDGRATEYVKRVSSGMEAENKARISKLEKTRIRMNSKRKFKGVEDLPNLKDIGVTRTKSEFHLYENGRKATISCDTDLITAPQFHLSKEVYENLPLKPKKLDACYCPNMILPIPFQRTFYGTEEEDVQKLDDTVFVRGFHIPKEQVYERERVKPMKSIARQNKFSTLASWMQSNKPKSALSFKEIKLPEEQLRTSFISPF